MDSINAQPTLPTASYTNAKPTQTSAVFRSTNAIVFYCFPHFVRGVQRCRNSVHSSYRSSNAQAPFWR